jgi:hypothetical protein
VVLWSCGPVVRYESKFPRKNQPRCEWNIEKEEAKQTSVTIRDEPCFGPLTFLVVTFTFGREKTSRV